MKKQILTCVMLLATIGFGYAQDSGTQSGGGGNFAPSAGDISVSILFGRYNFLQSGLSVPSAPYNNTSWTVSGSVPYLNTIDVTNDVTNMIGAEARYFVTSQIAATLSGGAIIRNSPEFVNIPGYIDQNAPNSAWIPAYSAVIGTNSVDANLNIGAEYLFTTKVPRLFPYVGVNIPFYYGRRSNFDPTIVDSDPNSSSPQNPYLADIGWRHSEIWGFGVQAVGGVDYYLGEGFYLGLEIKPISWVYAGVGNYPAPGLDAWKAETSTVSVFVQPFLKLGFKF
jgi:hypothetical protein